jgi:hypothetical protein
MNKWLKGNGYWCPSCNGTGRGKARDRMEYESGAYCQFYDPCSVCLGAKRMPATAQQIIDGTAPLTPEPAFHSCFSECIEYGSPNRRAAHA